MEFKQNWEFYHSLVENKAASIRLNLALAEVAPIDGYDHRIWFSIKLLNPDENGLVSNEEFAQVNSVEDDVADLFEKRGAIFVGTVKTDGTVDFFFYAKKMEDYKDIILSAMKNHREYLFASDMKEDKSWDEYFNYLYPGEFELQSIKNRQILMQLDKHGDNPELEREVDHWLYFNDEESKNKFGDEAKKLGYKILSSKKLDGDFPYQLNIARVDNLLWNNINSNVWELISLGKQYNGIYDGWGAPIAQE